LSKEIKDFHRFLSIFIQYLFYPVIKPTQFSQA